MATIHDITVLVVDDQPSMRMLHRQNLRELGIRTVIEAGRRQRAGADDQRLQALGGELQHPAGIGGDALARADRAQHRLAPGARRLQVEGLRQVDGDRRFVRHKILGGTKVSSLPMQATKRERSAFNVKGLAR